MENTPYGFVAFWKATDSWFAAEESVKKDFMDKLSAIMEGARSKGVETFGNFDCSWSCEWRYFTFWICPDLKILEETMEKLVEIGDINFYNEQHHYIGRRTKDDLVQ